MRFRVLAAVFLAAFAAVTLSCGSKGSSKEILVGEYGSLTGGTPPSASPRATAPRSPSRRSTPRAASWARRSSCSSRTTRASPRRRRPRSPSSSPRTRWSRCSARSPRRARSRPRRSARRTKIPMITPSSTNPRVTEVGDYIFRVCFIDPFQGTVMAKFAHDDSQGSSKVAILKDVQQRLLGRPHRLLRRGLHAARRPDRLGPVATARATPDFRAQLTAIKASNPEAIFVPGYYTEVGLIARQARELGITVPLLGGDGWDSAKLWRSAARRSNGCYFSNHYSADNPDPGRPELRHGLQAPSSTSDARRASAALALRRGQRSWPTR